MEKVCVNYIIILICPEILQISEILGKLGPLSGRTKWKLYCTGSTAKVGFSDQKESEGEKEEEGKKVEVGGAGGQEERVQEEALSVANPFGAKG